MEGQGFTLDYKKHVFYNSWGDLEVPDAFESLVHEFTGITFIFDLLYSGTAGGCDGDGRYFCVFEKGKKVYDANCWLEQLCFLNAWADSIGLDKGDFYFMDTAEARWAIAKGRLIEQGKEAGDISDDDIQEYLNNTGVKYEGWISGEEAFLFLGHDFWYWSGCLNNGEDLFDDDYGYEHYLELKGSDDLPSFNAVSRWNDLLGIADKESPEGVDILTKKWSRQLALPDGEWWEDKEQCLKLYAKDYGKHTEEIREYLGYCFPKEFWLDRECFEKTAKLTGKLYLAEAYTHDASFMKELQKLIDAEKKK
jgi:hypothetical protein